jgi:hypothetical protein
MVKKVPSDREFRRATSDREPVSIPLLFKHLQVTLEIQLRSGTLLFGVRRIIAAKAAFM